MQTLATKIISFYKSLHLDTKLPKGVAVMNPFQEKSTLKLVEQFYQKFYNDSDTRFVILGINPGRLGGGTTGIPFTDPKRLKEKCNIDHSLDLKTELSSDFIYQMIDAYGGAESFYSKFFLSAICPLGFTENGKNLNYYDYKSLQETVYPFIRESLKWHTSNGFNTEICFCLGEGKNFQFLELVNHEHHFFKKIIPLAHPRFIMQYKRKQLNDYFKDYLKKFSLA